MHLRLSVSSTRVVCGGIPVMPMESVVASHGHTVRIYGADGIFLVQETGHLTAHVWWRLIFKNLHDRQKKQHIFSLNKICYNLISLLMVLFPLSNCLTWTVFFPSHNNFDMMKYQSKEGKLQTIFSKLVKQSQPYQQTDLLFFCIGYIYLLLLLMYSLRGGKFMP